MSKEETKIDPNAPAEFMTIRETFYLKIAQGILAAIGDKASFTNGTHGQLLADEALQLTDILINHYNNNQ